MSTGKSGPTASRTAATTSAANRALRPGVPPVLVGALVEERRQELAQQVAVGGMDLDGVVAGGARPRSGAREGRRDGRDLFRRHLPAVRPGLGLQPRRARTAPRRASAAIGPVGHEPGVRDLQGHLSAGRVHGGGQTGERRHEAVVMGAELLVAPGRPPGRRRRDR